MRFINPCWTALAIVASLVLAGLGHQLITANADQSRKIVIGQALHDHDYATAARMLERIAENDPNDATAQATLGYVYEMTHQNDKAIAAYKRALTLKPDDNDLRQALEELQQQNPPK